VKLNNLTIVPKLGILVGVTLFGLCVAGVLAGYLMQREMLSARIDQVHAIVDMGRNMAIVLLDKDGSERSVSLWKQKQDDEDDDSSSCGRPGGCDFVIIRRRTNHPL